MDSTSQNKRKSHPIKLIISIIQGNTPSDSNSKQHHDSTIGQDGNAVNNIDQGKVVRICTEADESRVQLRSIDQTVQLGERKGPLVETSPERTPQVENDNQSERGHPSDALATPVRSNGRKERERCERIMSTRQGESQTLEANTNSMALSPSSSWVGYILLLGQQVPITRTMEPSSNLIQRWFSVSNPDLFCSHNNGLRQQQPNIVMLATNANGLGLLQLPMPMPTSFFPRPQPAFNYHPLQQSALGFPSMQHNPFWFEEELDALWVGVRRHGQGNWEAILRDPELRFINKSADLSRRWQMERGRLGIL